MKRLSIYANIFLILILIPSCGKDPVSKQKNDFVSTDFPVNIGNWWEYKVTDFLGGTEDTLKIEVISKAADDNFLCYLMQNNLIIDSAIIELNNTKYKYEGLHYNYSYFGDLYLEFPLNVGTYFNISSLDSAYVVSYVENKIIAGNSYNLYNLRRESISPGFSIVQTISISKGVGIVEQTYDLFNSFPVQRQNFKLINYHLED